MRGEVLIDGWPWGWGADAALGYQKGWRCHNCSKVQPKKAGGPLLFGEELWCPTCARERCQREYTRCYSEDAPWHSPWRRALEARGRRRVSTSDA